MKKGSFRGLFRLDSWWLRLANQVYDLIMTNLLWLLSALPLVTLGMAKLYSLYGISQWRFSKDYELLVSFRQAWRCYWRIGLSLSALDLGFRGLCLVNLYLVLGQTSWPFLAYKVLIVQVYLLTDLFLFYLYPLALREGLTWKERLQKALLFLVGRPRISLLALGLGLVSFLLYTFNSQSFFVFLWFHCMIGQSLWSWFQLEASR